jgi:Icc protein
MRKTLLAQLSDPHIREPGRLAYGRIDTAPYLRRAVEAVLRLRQAPDAVVITGDLVDFGRGVEYAHLAELLKPLPMPVYLLPGNHDDRDHLREAFPHLAYLGESGPIQYSVRIGHLQMIATDTSVPGQSRGELDADRLEWLAQALESSRDMPVIVAMHHPPFPTLIGHMDKIGLLSGAEALATLISRYPNVERIICGHVHRAIDIRFGGTIASVCPAPAHQVVLDLADDAPSAWILEPPAFRLHALDQNGQVVTHLSPVGQFDGPYPFHDGDKLID